MNRADRAFLRVLLRVHPLVWGAATGLFFYLVTGMAGIEGDLGGLCVDCWVSAVGAPEVAGALGAAGTSVGTKAIKDSIQNKVGAPIFKYKDMYDIASQDTPEEQAEVAWKKFKSLIMTEHAPEGSAGDEINKAIDRFLDFHKDGIDLGGGHDDDDP